MEYSVKKLAQTAGVSARTLRYYDEIGLLTPARISSNGYRVYGEKEIDLLQQIMFYREMGMPLEEIKMTICADDFDKKRALENHLCSLNAKKKHINLLIKTVEKTISTMKGEIKMTDKEKFEGFKENILRVNEEKYGAEIRETYGAEIIDASNRKFKNMTQEQYDEANALAEEINSNLKEAFLQGDPSSKLAQEVCALHKKWLCLYWDKYSKEAHVGLAQMYVDDPRFTEYYDKVSVGAAEFLRDAIQIYCYKRN